MKLIAAACTSAMFLAACNAQPPAPTISYVKATLTPAQTKAVQDGLRRTLKDPASAQFGPMVAAQGSDGSLTVCGYINGRNSYGGYTGMLPFYGTLPNAKSTDFDSAIAGPTDSSLWATRTLCARAGLKV